MRLHGERQRGRAVQEEKETYALDWDMTEVWQLLHERNQNLIPHVHAGMFFM